jgi:tetratricopeptide (TPR) repeat protein
MVQECDFEESLLKENFVEILELNLKSLLKFDPSSIKNHVEQTPKEEIFKFGVAAFLLFVQQSYTGPTVQWTSHEFLKIQEPKQVWDQRYLKLLEKNGEEPYHLTPDPFLLYIASTLLFLEFEESLKVNWWRARVLFINQRILENYSEQLLTKTLLIFEKIEPLLQNDKSLNAKYYLELGMFHHYYGNHKLGLIQFQKAQNQTGLHFKITGIMGKRTKFQSFETSQLAITAKSNLKIEDDKDKNVPLAHELNDDTLLENIAYTSNDETLKGNLNQIDQSLLLAFWYFLLTSLDVKNTNPIDGLTTEQMFPYVLRVLENHNNWMITTMALLLKSRLEGAKSRTVERSCLQLQTLVDQWKFQDEDASVSKRLQHLFSLFVPSKWEMEKELGEKFASIGVIRSALEIFERLELWENCISCHQMLEQGKKADALISRLLVIQPEDPKLLCLLGDVRGDKSFYENAWKLSGNRFSRAMRSLGSYYFSAEDWSLSIECYDKALAINPMFENSWFIMGCSALRIDDFTTASRAFNRVVQIDPDVIFN